MITVAATVFLTRDDSQSGPPTAGTQAVAAPPDTSQMASAGDDGPVNVITDDPTCAAWTPIAETFAAQASKGWNDRHSSIPRSAWTTEQRAQHLAMVDAMVSAADQTAALVKLTPHRAMRELYEQSIAYWRAYADSVSAYTPEDDPLARVATATSNAIGYICGAITYGSAASRAPLVQDSIAPLEVASPSPSGEPQRYVLEQLSVCADWILTASKFDTDTEEWLGTDPNIPASEWSPEQRATYERMPSVMGTNAGQIENLGAQSLNPIFEDFAVLAAQYRWAFIQSIPSYVPADGYLANASAELVAANGQACKAVGVR